MATDLTELQNKLWEAADQLRANSGLKASEYATPVLGLLFLRYADERFEQAMEQVAGYRQTPHRAGGLPGHRALYLPPESRFDPLLDLPEGEGLGKAINKAMNGIEVFNLDLQGVLPRDYSRIPDERQKSVAWPCTVSPSAFATAANRRSNEISADAPRNSAVSTSIASGSRIPYVARRRA